MADYENDSTEESDAASADLSSAGGRRPTGRSGAHAFGAGPSDGREPDAMVEPDELSERRPSEPGNELVLDDGDKELVAVGAASGLERAGTGRAALARDKDKNRDKKAKSTPRQKQVAEKEHRTGPVTFVRESISELQKVVYPTGQQLVNYFVVVLIFVLFIIAIVSLLDLAFGKAILAVFS